MKSDQELKKVFQLKFSEKLLTLIFKIENKEDEEHIKTSELVADEIDKLLAGKNTKEINLLIDMTLLTSLSFLPSKARRNYADILKKHNFRKIVFAGGNVAIKTIASFIIKFSSKSKNFKWIEDKKEALEWIKK